MKIKPFVAATMFLLEIYKGCLEHVRNMTLSKHGLLLWSCRANQEVKPCKLPPVHSGKMDNVTTIKVYDEM